MRRRPRLLSHIVEETGAYHPRYAWETYRMPISNTTKPSGEACPQRIVILVEDERKRLAVVVRQDVQLPFGGPSHPLHPCEG